MTILVTGGTGLVGRAICGGLVERGHHVRCADRMFKPQDGVEAVVVDLRIREAAYALLADVDAVVHLANHANQWRTDAQTLVAENTAVNVNVFQAAAECGVGAVIFASSVQVASGVPLDTRAGRDQPEQPVYPLFGDSPARPGNAYAVSKVLGETLLRYHAETHGLAATTLRLPFIVRGRHGLERQAAHMARDTWPHEGFSWLWAGDLGGLVHALLVEARPGYRCLLPSAPPMLDLPEVRAAANRWPEARVAEPGVDFPPGWRPTPLVDLPRPDAT